MQHNTHTETSAEKGVVLSNDSTVPAPENQVSSNPFLLPCDPSLGGRAREHVLCQTSRDKPEFICA